MTNIQLILEELAVQNQTVDLAPQEDKAKKALILAQHALDAIHAKTKTLLDAASAHKVNSDASPPSPKLLGSSNGVPDSSVPDSYQAIAAKIAQFISDLSNGEGDPTTLLLNFSQFIGNLTASGQIGEFSGLLDSASVTTALAIAMQQGMESAFFNGYNGQKGEAGAQAFLTNMNNYLQGFTGSQDNEYIQAMQDSVSGLQADLSTFTQNHTDANGNLFWTYDENGVDVPYYASSDLDTINLLIQTSGLTGSPNSYLDNLNLDVFLANYRMTVINQLLATVKNPEILLMLLVGTVYDNQFQNQEGGLANTTNILTKLTNTATKLDILTQGIGPNMTQAQAEQIKTLTQQLTVEINIYNQTESLSGSWNSNVYDSISGVSVTVNGQQTTLGALFNATGPDAAANLLAGFVSLIPTSPSGSNGGSTSPGLNTLLTAVQQGNTLVTGEAKTTSTKISAVASLDNAVVSMMQNFVGAQTGGFVNLENTIVSNQVSH